ncbi:hypothetical protein SISSUDRAFT_985301, partial [Sistotremastrum suecicum HHB10207 ss-3]
FINRVCPGRHFASASLWLAMATLLSVFDISIPTDEKGYPITTHLEYENGPRSHPKPFQCKFTVRNDIGGALFGS